MCYNTTAALRGKNPTQAGKIMEIKMICSDLDGTLLQYGRTELEPEVYELIAALADRDILFYPTSGRQ